MPHVYVIDSVVTAEALINEPQFFILDDDKRDIPRSLVAHGLYDEERDDLYVVASPNSDVADVLMALYQLNYPSDETTVISENDVTVPSHIVVKILTKDVFNKLHEKQPVSADELQFQKLLQSNDTSVKQAPDDVAWDFSEGGSDDDH